MPLGGLAALALYLLVALRATTRRCSASCPTPARSTTSASWPRPAATDINRYAAPIAVSPGIELLTVAGVGLVALAVDTSP